MIRKISPFSIPPTTTPSSVKPDLNNIFTNTTHRAFNDIRDEALLVHCLTTNTRNEIPEHPHILLSLGIPSAEEQGVSAKKIRAH